MNYVSLDALNDAKKRINYLMKVKYNDPSTEYVETDDTDADTIFQSVITGVKTGSDLFYQILTLIARSNTGVLYFRSGATFISFQQILLKLRNLLQTINKTIYNLNNKFGYVEPDNMAQFRENMLIFRDASDKYIGFTRGDRLNIKKQKDTYEQEEANIEEFNKNILDESRILKENSDKIDATYNFRSSNVQQKRSAPIVFDNTPSNNNFDDEEF